MENMAAISLKPQDVMVLVKLCGYPDSGRPAYSVIAAGLKMSQSEINASVKRLQSAKLVHEKDLGEGPILAAVEEFLIHAVKYVFPAEYGRIGRGMPTSYAAEPLSRLIDAGDNPIPVWPDPNGTKRGLYFYPIYKSVPEAAKQDPVLYARLAMIDAIRDGSARERKLAEEHLRRSLRGKRG
jgi:hypothetical protein